MGGGKVIHQCNAMRPLCIKILQQSCKVAPQKLFPAKKLSKRLFLVQKCLRTNHAKRNAKKFYFSGGLCENLVKQFVWIRFCPNDPLYLSSAMCYIWKSCLELRIFKTRTGSLLCLIYDQKGCMCHLNLGIIRPKLSHLGQIHIRNGNDQKPGLVKKSWQYCF